MGTSASNTQYYPVLAGVFAIVTALFWGCYGPVLHKGAVYMGEIGPNMGSGRLRPFLCVGLAYFLISIVGPIVMMQVAGMEKGNGLLHGWTFSGIVWSVGGGAAGALGAFALIMALNYGGPTSPTFVMPMVFGAAPVVSTCVAMYFNKTYSQVSPFFLVGLLLVILGAVTILVTAPKPGKPKAAVEKTNSETSTKAELEKAK
ncbi:hypothetical protein ETAA8_71100 [Anatilimnocola aggregata]|uniref:Uncharacterized protein n=1 Tax=Anatilimnocola aggregata TaxID=2528021 RepID=A0A517YNZ1_9BACT|nr:hypothetical protein [Anatilimnocola aggregata]QDU31948.1 hypothetical protein ETAA8_71100 [Anatilimnocola aggregata]